MHKMPALRAVADPVLRIYLRRSKGDAQHQHFSLDVQREGARQFAERMGLDWSKRVEYVDDDRAGDDFLGRAGLSKLMRDARPGDVIICRDQSRLGREAIQVTLAVQELVRDRHANLHYYISGQHVQFANAIDGATVFIQGTGHQMELENIRSRTREAIRDRVRLGRVAGGRCYGYALKRQHDADGRPYTIAVIDPEQAKIVQRVFDEYISGAGLKQITRRLNKERIPSPSAGKRGTGSWAPSAIYTMLRNERYRGIYTHGKTNRRRVGDKRIAEAADPAAIMRVEIADWRIIDDAVWFAAQDIAARRGAESTKGKRAPGPAAKHALAGIGKCSECGGSIGVANTKLSGGVRAKAYTCTYHHYRGREVCPVTVYQPIEEVEAAIAQHIYDEILTDDVIDVVLTEIRNEVEARKEAAPDVAAIEADLTKLRAEQANLARAIATAGDAIPELVAELRKRNDRIRSTEADLEVARRTPAMLADHMRRVEECARAKLRDLRRALVQAGGRAREVFFSLYPEGIRFHMAENENRRVWALEVPGADLGSFILTGDPTGSFLKLGKPRRCEPRPDAGTLCLGVPRTSRPIFHPALSASDRLLSCAPVRRWASFRTSAAGHLNVATSTALRHPHFRRFPKAWSVYTTCRAGEDAARTDVQVERLAGAVA